jgi:hypothetical protein
MLAGGREGKPEGRESMKAAGLVLPLAALTIFAQHPDISTDGTIARVQLLERNEVADTVRGAVRLARVRVTVNGKEVWLECGNYRLPVTAGGVQIDCSVTKGLLINSRANP